MQTKTSEFILFRVSIFGPVLSSGNSRISQRRNVAESMCRMCNSGLLPASLVIHGHNWDASKNPHLEFGFRTWGMLVHVNSSWNVQLFERKGNGEPEHTLLTAPPSHINQTNVIP